MVFTWSLPDRGLSHGWRLSTSWLLAPSRSGVEARLRATWRFRCRRGGPRERRSLDSRPPPRSSSRPPPPRLSSPASRPGRVLGAGAPPRSSTATATASLYFLSAWYCSAPPPRLILRQSASCPPLSQCWRWQASLQYLVLHLLHFFPRLWASGAAQAAQFVRIILVWRGRFERLRRRGVFWE